jgi:hypothetical protein
MCRQTLIGISATSRNPLYLALLCSLLSLSLSTVDEMFWNNAQKPDKRANRTDSRRLDPMRGARRRKLLSVSLEF